MENAEILTWAKSNIILTLIISLTTFGFIIAYWQSISFRAQIYISYLVIIILVLFWSAYSSMPYLYFFVFALGGITACAEIIQKFPDDPFVTLGTWESLIYNVFNGIIAISALKILLIFEVPYQTDLDKLQLVLAAGLGSMLIMRSKLFNVKVGNEEIAIGPEQLINIFLRSMEHAIDRVRAVTRIEFVKKIMNNLDFTKVFSYTLSMLESTQALGKKKDELIKAMDDIDKGRTQDPQLMSYQLGFELLNVMGEDFVTNLYANPKPEWLISAPKPEHGTDWVNRIIPERIIQRSYKERELFVYDTLMSINELAEELNWTVEYVKKIIPDIKYRKATLPGYKLVFNGRSSNGEQILGLPNIEPDPSSTVEGILYSLSEGIIKYMDEYKNKNGFERKPIKVNLIGQEGKEINAESYFAIETQSIETEPNNYLENIVAAAEEAKLDQTYINNLINLI